MHFLIGYATLVLLQLPYEHELILSLDQSSGVGTTVIRLSQMRRQRCESQK